MSLLYRIAADVVVVLHVGYVTFVVVGLAAVLIGAARGWTWVRNPWFRWTHLAAILIVVMEAWCGIVCPLTTWEHWLREWGGQSGTQGDFIATWLHRLLFFEAPAWVFTVAYTLFGLAVVTAFVIAPPRPRQAARRR